MKVIVWEESWLASWFQEMDGGLCFQNTRDLFEEATHTNHEETSSKTEVNKVGDRRKAVNGLPNEEFEQNMILGGLAEVGKLGRSHAGFRA